MPHSCTDGENRALVYARGVRKVQVRKAAVAPRGGVIEHSHKARPQAAEQLLDRRLVHFPRYVADEGDVVAVHSARRRVVLRLALRRFCKP